MKQAPPADPTKDGIPLPLTLQAPACARAGQTIDVTLTTEADVDVAMIMQFSDERTDEKARAIGTTDRQGRFTTKLVIPATASVGDAKLYAAAGSGGRAATREHTVRVVAPTGKC